MNGNAAEVLQHPASEQQQIEQQALTLKDQASAIKVTCAETYATAGEMVKALKDMKSKITGFFGPMKKKAHESWKTVCSSENEALAPVDEADKILRREMGRYLDEQERIKREAEARARREEEERARKERGRLLAQATKAEEKGNADRAEALLEKAENVFVAPVIVDHAVEKTVKIGDGGVTRRTDIEITVTDIKALCAEVAAGRVPESAVEAKPGALKSWAKLMKVKSCPGLVIREVSSVSVR